MLRDDKNFIIKRDMALKVLDSIKVPVYKTE